MFAGALAVCCRRGGVLEEEFIPVMWLREKVLTGALAVTRGRGVVVEEEEFTPVM